jgi:hypothetical protein
MKNQKNIQENKKSYEIYEDGNPLDKPPKESKPFVEYVEGLQRRALKRGNPMSKESVQKVWSALRQDPRLIPYLPITMAISAIAMELGISAWASINKINHEVQRDKNSRIRDVACI